MSDNDEEPYSTIFASLKHPIRRRILRMLSEKPMSFSEMLGALGVSSSFLTYHLENLGELLGKMEDGKYKLSSFGEAAMATMTKVEDIPTTALQQSSETKPKKVIGRSVAIALGIISILLIASLGGASAYYTVIIHNKENELGSANNTINQLNTNATNLQNQDKQLQTWLDGNKTLLNQTQANNTNLQKIADLQESTVIVQNYLVDFTPFLSIVVVSNNTVLPSKVIYWNDSSFNQIPSYHVGIDHAGYIIVNATPSNSVVELEYSSNGLNYNNTVNFGNNTISVFPVLPTTTLMILVGSNYSSFPQFYAETVTITYYY